MKDLKDKSDDKLISLYVDGCNEAFDELLERHKQLIYSYIRYTVRDNQLADDIFQETFIKVITTIKQGRYFDNGKFAAWVMRIAHNLIIDYYRQERVENVQSADAFDIDLYNKKEYSDITVEEELIKRQTNLDVKRLISSLPRSQREVIEMRYYLNMSYKEIADATQVSINTALGRMRYALMNMRRYADEKNIILTT
ncbi:MAG: sigma-70 family RNA polymerase sigma factor [Alphaproteobacteria bacterium]|jgi:RNA polymerase sigma-70 factor (ECF subfamily)|nr:sigma-70 family RNA polymerase sigma factor [Alphaproteobacteria bacterium]